MYVVTAGLKIVNVTVEIATWRYYLLHLIPLQMQVYFIIKRVRIRMSVGFSRYNCCSRCKRFTAVKSSGRSINMFKFQLYDDNQSNTGVTYISHEVHRKIVHISYEMFLVC